jgi:hypothetical protein
MVCSSELPSCSIEHWPFADEPFFQAYYPILDEAAAALDRAGQFLSTHLAGAERVTGERKAERMLS